MEKDIYETVYTADDEEPVCTRCDNMNIPYTWCERYCGAEHGWNGYKRTERSNHERRV